MEIAATVLLPGSGAANTSKKACFVAGTAVETVDGPQPIESVEAGDWVLSRDEITGQVGYKQVVRAFVRHEIPVLELALADDDIGQAVEYIQTTGEHPFWVTGEGWTYAAELQIGSRVETLSGARVVVAAMWQRSRQTVYNFEVADWHTYFVGNDSVWVHNDCVPDSVDGIADFMIRNQKRMKSKLGRKTGRGRLPFSASKEGVVGAQGAVRETLATASQTSGIFKTRGGFEAKDVYSAQTGMTVRVRLNGEFDTLIPEMSDIIKKMD